MVRVSWLLLTNQSDLFEQSNVYYKWAIPGPFFFLYIFSLQLTVNVQRKFWQRLYSNHGPLESDCSANWATPLPNFHLNLIIEIDSWVGIR